MIVGNLIGFVMVFVAAGVCALITKVVGHAESNTLALIFTAPVLIALDLAYRKYRGATLFGRAGGRLFFLPAWLIGSLLGLLGIASLFQR
ncbi:MAG TPA: hypothetical protein VFP84_27755 [Kofleriaceae bacterium]|nr:hypothetical protein [Kofleriaceae bacterium]